MIAELLNQSIDWTDYTICGGRNALDVRLAIDDLLAASDTEESENAYWRLENVIVSQGFVYPAAVPAMRVLTAALAEERPLWVRIRVYNLMYNILRGWDAECATPTTVLADECRRQIMAGFWLIVRDCVAKNTGNSAQLDVLLALNPGIDLADVVKGYPGAEPVEKYR